MNDKTIVEKTDSMKISRGASGKIAWEVKVYGCEPKECHDKLYDAVDRIKAVLIEKHLEEI